MHRKTLPLTCFELIPDKGVLELYTIYASCVFLYSKAKQNLVESNLDGVDCNKRDWTNLNEEVFHELGVSIHGHVDVIIILVFVACGFQGRQSIFHG